LVVASAGSGKTEVLTQRLARILHESRGESFRCLAVTYTVKASEELRSRIRATAAAEAWRVDADTLHGFALDWLRRYGEVVDVLPDVVVYSDDSDRVALISEYIASLGLQDHLNGDVTRVLGPILQRFDHHRTASPLEPFSWDGTQFAGVPIAELYEGYLEALSRAGGIDFPGMLNKLLEAVRVDEWISRNFRSLYRHVLVDEGQDLTRAQSELLRALIGDDVDVFVVADDRQSINGFAGGSFDNAKFLVGEEAASAPLGLRHNFRSSASIMQAAESLAAHFASSSISAHIVENSPPGAVRVVRCAHPDHEAEVVVSWVDQLLTRGLATEAITSGEDPTVRPEEIAIIGRARWTLDPVLAALANSGIPHAVQVEASGFLMTPEGRIAIDALAIELNPSDAPAKRRVRDELADLEIARSGDLVSVLRESALDSLAPIADMLECVRRQDPLDQAFESLEHEHATGWRGDAAKLKTLWADYRAGTSANRRSLRDYLAYVARAQRTRPSDPGVRVMTIHRAKGLEFRAVAVIGARNGTLPDYRATAPEDLDAERRSFYVAITRASRDLLVTWPELTVDRYGRQHRQAPSIFLDEAALV
jgi:DNA helicase-2/ATP-dependent DNA helicase PcrA